MGKRRTAEDRLRAVAYHEAGHAVALLFLMETPSTITLEEASDAHIDTLGYWAETLQRKNIDKHLLVCLCGPVAEQRSEGLQDIYLGVEPGLTKYLRLDVIVYSYCWPGLIFAKPENCQLTMTVLQKFVEFMQARAELLIHYLWECVEAIAEALLERGSLTGEEIKALYEPFKRLEESKIVFETEPHVVSLVKY